MKTYKKHYDFVLLSTDKLLETHRKNISKKNNFLADLGIKIFAYQSAASSKENNDFKQKVKDVYERDLIEDIAKYEGIYKEEECLNIEKIVKESIEKSSLRDKEMIERFRKLAAETKIKKLKPKYIGENKEEYVGPSLIEEYLFENRELRKKAANDLKNELELQNNAINKLQETAFNELLKMVNVKNSQYVSADTLKTLKFLEKCIEDYFPVFLKDLGLNIKRQRLIDLRKTSTTEYNSACYSCGRIIQRRNNNRWCTKQENRKCYEEGMKEIKRPAFPECISRTKNQCENCGHLSPLDHIYKTQGTERQFCSQKCYETFRKKTQRKRQK